MAKKWTEEEAAFVWAYRGYSLCTLCMVLSLFGFRRTLTEIANKILWFYLQKEI